MKRNPVMHSAQNNVESMINEIYYRKLSSNLIKINYKGERWGVDKGGGWGRSDTGVGGGDNEVGRG